MPNGLVISTRFNQGKFEVKAEVKAGSDLPVNIFIYEKDSQGGLAGYVGVAFLPDLGKLKVYNPDKKSNFGSRYCLYHEAVILCDTSVIQSQAVTHMKDTFTRLVDQFKAGAAEVTEVYNVL